ncbi:cyclin-like protein [Basidiobolus meristosporus CBS 931.73]|uniref:Cyclin-like protein n=1 Tax=Basidiobolus meristosporus CBS 931.73 TaxID=1314790 RepID=A0A1Y1YRG2_9FUNG|nr:cyclin-like protein [Basidiobolus meristosporus CBS 931.73]|eukprot:ORY00404.1 cyclin-like protein [Basidiobolus meristosporus CBS 931.73]
MAKDLRPLYEQSSQYRSWRFSEKQLQEIRQISNQASIERVKTNLEEAKQLGDSQQSNGQTNYLNVQDEMALVGFYETKVRDFCKAFQFPNKVKATAITYMKRFFLYNTVMDYHPKTIMLTSLFLATKVENSFISIDDFAQRIPKTTAQSILDLEFIISQSLKFEFTIHHPYRPLHGLYLDMQSHIQDLAILTSTYEKAVDWVDKSLYTDLIFLYQPSQIAMGAMNLAGKQFRCDVEGYLKQKFEHDPDSFAKLQKILGEIEQTLQDYKPVQIAVVREIDRRLIFCRNPEKNPESLLFKRKKAQEEEEENQRKLKKQKLVEEKEKEIASVLD